MIARTIDELAGLYDAYGNEHYDEAISQMAHAEQTAALAVRDRASNAVVVAALLHDVGHLLYLAHGDSGPHERTGVEYLRGLFDDAVLAPIEAHVAAKRCLCAIDDTYYEGLSAGSKRSLHRQGGPMDRDDAERFAAADPEALRLRRWDDLGKVDELTVRPFADYLPLLASLAR